MSETSKKDNFKNTLCYVPLVAFFLLFSEENKSQDLKKHINYWMFLFWILVILIILISIFLSFIPVVASFLKVILLLTYFVASWFFGYKAYNWEKVSVEVLETIEDRVKDNFK